MSTISKEREEVMISSTDDLAPPRRRKTAIVPLAVGAIALAVVGYGAWHFLAPHAAKKPAAPAPVSVTVQTVQQKTIRLWSEFSGRLHAVDSAEIRPEVSGRITEVRFDDGQDVKAGDILFVIDPRPYEAAAMRAQARIASAKATLEFTEADQIRAATLIKTHAIPQRELDQANSANDTAAAALQSAEADLKTAEVDVDHAYVKAPITGRVGRAELRVGNLVMGGTGASTPPPLLTVVVSENSIYADFEVDEQTYLETIRDAANGNAQEQQIPVQLVVQGDRERRVYHGFIESFDNRLDVSSGTIRARAQFTNVDRSLVPGMFVSVKLASSRDRSVLMVPERSVGSDQSKKFAYVIGAGSKASYRELELGREAGGMRIVEKGLQPGDRVVVDGLQHVKPDAVVAAQELPPSAGESETEASLIQGKNATR
jgi:multidrug efflux system membrane fusion protein